MELLILARSLLIGANSRRTYEPRRSQRSRILPWPSAFFRRRRMSDYLLLAGVVLLNVAGFVWLALTMDAR